MANTPDGYRADSWWVDDDDPKRDEHTGLMFAIGLRLNSTLAHHMPSGENESARVFPERARREKEEDERYGRRQSGNGRRTTPRTPNITVKEPHD